MDAKMRANFINSVAGGQKIPCPSCNTLNKADSRFCITCGTKLGGVDQEMPVMTEQKITCPSCKTLNDGDSLFCVACGTKLDSIPSTTEASSGAAFSPVTEKPIVANSEPSVVKKPEKKTAFKFVEPEVLDVEEPPSVFAEGLPSWDIVPPQVMVRRKAKR